jgi:ribosome-associated protein
MDRRRWIHILFSATLLSPRNAGVFYGTGVKMPESLEAQSDPALQLAVQLAGLAADTRCVNVTVLDVRARSPVTRFFVIATGTSSRQLRTVADELSDFGKRSGSPAWRTSGYEAARWVLIDFVDVVAHVFDEQSRNFYDLELLWGDCPKVDWRAMLGRPADSGVIQTPGPISPDEYTQTDETEEALTQVRGLIGEALGAAGDMVEEFVEEVILTDVKSVDLLDQPAENKPAPRAKPRKAAAKSVKAKRKTSAKKPPAKTKRKPAAKSRAGSPKKSSSKKVSRDRR